MMGTAGGLQKAGVGGGRNPHLENDLIPYLKLGDLQVNLGWQMGG